MNPLLADAHTKLGNLLKEERQLDQALAATLNSLEFQLDNSDGHMPLAGIYKELAEHANAETAVD